MFSLVLGANRRKRGGNGWERRGWPRRDPQVLSGRHQQPLALCQGLWSPHLLLHPLCRLHGVKRFPSLCEREFIFVHIVRFCDINQTIENAFFAHLYRVCCGVSSYLNCRLLKQAKVGARSAACFAP